MIFKNPPPPAAQFFWHKRLFWLVCGFPTLISAFYLFIWATPRYESEAILRVYEAGQDATTASGAIEGLGGGIYLSPGTYILKSYLSSWDIFQALDPSLMAKEWGKGDFFHRFGGSRTFFSKNQMRLWAYYKSHLSAKIDENSGLLTVRAQGYDADFPYTLVSRALELAKNQLSQSGIKADEAERKMLLKRLDDDRTKLAGDLDKIQALQRVAGVSDLQTDYQAIMQSLANSQKERLILNTRAAATAFLAQRNQRLEALKRQLTAIDQDIARQRSEIGEKSKVYKAFSQLQRELSEDAQIIMLDNTSLLESEQNSVRHAYYIDFVENPVKPTNPTLPHALMWSVIITAITFAFYVIIK